jgi:glycosyltransferase involved in cell wall biosynthesis
MKPLVSIVSLTYNHEKYIKQALDSFVMQKTNFNYEIVVHDDASSDNTPNIIKEYELKYPNLFRPIYQEENQKSKGGGIVTRIAFYAARGKYIAICEGDDYWTDPRKLQKQVDFLEANPDYGLVHTDCVIVDKNGNPLPDDILDNKRKAIRDGKVFYPLLEKNNFISTLTVCCRADIMKELSDRILSENLWYVQDYWHWLHISMQSKIKYFPEKTAAYREHQDGISKAYSNKYFAKRYLYFITEVVECCLKNKNNKPKTKYQKHVIARKLIFYFRHENIMIKDKFHLIKFFVKYPSIIGYFISLILNKLLRGKKNNS